MTLLQVQIDEKLKEAIKKKSAMYGVPVSSLVKIVLTKSFMEEAVTPGNVFNADRDDGGKGLPIDNLIDAL
jgi:antitoxin component of RelBE/YafQ-DinJ toxin-antitoxin module